MPSIKLETGIELNYIDSGAPKGLTSYETVIIAHGVAYNQSMK